ncbi:AAA family ATPase [Paenibacillus sp. Soil787]|uniref:SF1B family DNA helicase RecD2 n=1 Tax=Paenibacillus sp. Soil787 TaxID=1736411 RepID=UPI00070340B6|nr:AAA family ATPase [Paenibacillus sp. Soil787]KRF22524.1 hypothetical protein ASG93_29855 [Paenibacillus sp. Soil787]
MSVDENCINIRGVVEEVLYENAFGWSALRLRSDGVTMRAIGTLGRVKKGEIWSISGVWEHDLLYGAQIKITSGYPVMPTGSDELIALLSGDQFPGIGASTASSLVRAYGNELWKVLENDPNRIEREGIITPNKARLLLEALNGLQYRWKLLRYLVENKLPLRLLQPLATLYLDKAVEQIQENPYRLLSFTDWETADRIAMTLQIPSDDRRRLEASVIHVLQQYLGRGNTAMYTDILLQKSSRILSVSPESIQNFLKEPFIIFAGENLVQLTGIASQERTVARVFAELSYNSYPLASTEWVEKWLDEYERTKGIKLDFDQRLAVHEAVNHRLLVLTGGAGVGKTLVIDAIRSILADLGELVMLTAPTGRAAKRIQETTGKETKTLHRTFGYSLRDFDFRKDIELTALVIDESSMVDLRLWSTIVASVNENTRLIIVGDAGQLPSVGPGQILNDLLKSNVPSAELIRIHRQASDNPIPYITTDIRQGKTPDLPAWKHQLKGVFLISQENEGTGAEWTVRLATEALPLVGIPLEQTQILSPLRKSLCGTRNINSMVRKKLGRVDINQRIPFSVGDRVIQTANNYDLGTNGVMNGSTGIVVEYLDDGVIVDFDGELVQVSGAAVGELDCAYSISVHKSQGSQYRAVIIPLYPTAGPLLNRQLIYTAITRATDIAFIIGTKEMFDSAIKNCTSSSRTTAFSIHLKQALFDAARKQNEINYQLNIFNVMSDGI